MIHFFVRGSLCEILALWTDKNAGGNAGSGDGGRARGPPDHSTGEAIGFYSDLGWKTSASGFI